MTVSSPLPAPHRRAAVLLPRPSIRASGIRSLALGSQLLQPVAAVCATRRGLLSSFLPVHLASPASQRVRVAPVPVAASPAMTAAMASAEAAKRPFVGDLGVRSGFVDAVGNTPLIRLNRASQETGCEIYGKAEFLNPGGSVKDRAALYIIKAAEASGELREGGVIVEGTAGNTGIGLALVANARGYKTVIVIPETQSQEKKDMLRIAGATLVEVPAVPYKNPNNYVKYSGRLAQAIAKTHPGGAIWGNQFDNTANRQAHYETTGPEIWAQTEGRVDAFICAIGTGGTLAGTGKYLKERKAGVRVGMVDPMGAAMFSYYSTGTLEAHGSSISEGIGQGRITGNLQGWGLPEREGGCVDFCSVLAAAAPHVYPACHSTCPCCCLPPRVQQVEDAEALPVVYDLLRYEGLCVGLSSGINVAGAMRLARAMGPGHTIVTVLCDVGTRYQGRLFNPPFLTAKGLPLPAWMDSGSEPAVAVPQVFQEVEA
ncbi:unnamed protein product [Closterium sp. NIES-64]|nr:unnamed protein product [Closterium sp. NIES-64]CAI6008526.1 unnamed protein product [Closterium sp. NIES-65]